MREYHAMGQTVDLDDPKTYSGMSEDEKILDDQIFKSIGYYYCYVKYWYPNFYEAQEQRVHLLVSRFTSGRINNYGNIMWLQEILFLIEDETENMC